MIFIGKSFKVYINQGPIFVGDYQQFIYHIFLIVLDVLKPLQHKRLIEKELEGFGIRLNKEPPQIGFRRKEKGGVNLQVLCQQSELDIDLVSWLITLQ